MAKKAIILLSGGLDSATALHWALRRKKWRCHCLLMDYGQRHRRELAAAARIAARAGCEARRVSFRLPWGGSSLINAKEPIPARGPAGIGRGRLPSTYVPARNTLFLSYALSWADVLGAENIVIGANALDYSGYPDCRPRYLAAMERAARLGTRLGAEMRRPIKIWAPLVGLTKAQIVRLGRRLAVPQALTWSCYRGGRRPCGRCDSCRLRAKGFKEAGVPDPALKK